MLYLRIGFRNILKNFRRSLITMIPIIIGMISSLLIQGFFNWNMNELREAMIHHQGLGHYQLYASGFSKFGNDDPYQYLINDPASILRELRKIPEIQMVSTRMTFSGILSSGEKSAIVVGEAVNPKYERKLNSNSSLIRGTRLSPLKPDGLVLGDGVVKKLSAHIGDTLTLMGTMSDGVLNAVDLELVGVTHSGIVEADNMSASTSLGVIQNLLGIDQSVQRIVVLLKETKDTKKILPQIKNIANQYKLEYKDWQSLAEFYQSVKQIYNVVFLIIILIVLTIVTFTISNTVNMNLYERVREIGTIRALGTKKMQVAWIFIVESFFMGVIGSFAGLGISFFFISVIELTGGLPIMIHGTGHSAWIRIFFHPDLTTIVACIVLFSLVAVLASLNPSRRASKISITQALRWI